MKKYMSLEDSVAVKAPEFKQVETKIVSGFATISQRTDLLELDLVMDGRIGKSSLTAGVNRVLVRGDAGLRPWAKVKFFIHDMEFVLCPASEVIGITTDMDAIYKIEEEQMRLREKKRAEQEKNIHGWIESRSTVPSGGSDNG